MANQNTRSVRGKRVDDKNKLGTTILVKTDNNISMFRDQYPKEFKTPGEVVDLMASLCLRINASAAAEIYEFCTQRAAVAEEELYRTKGCALAEFQAAEIRDRLDYFKSLAAHMSRFLPQGEIPSKRAAMKRVDMRKGAYLVIPDEWVVLNESEAMTSDYAFVVEAHNCEAYDVPHFVYLSNVESCSRQEIIDAAASCWPKMGDILKMQVEPVYDKDGNLLNGEEWMEAPAVGIFPILDSTSYAWGEEAPFGAMIYRK